MRFRMHTLILSAVATLAAVSLPSFARAHDDVVPYAWNGKIVAGGHDDTTLSDTIEMRVFGYDFGEDPGDPFFIGDPGFNNGAFAIGVFPNDGLLPTGHTLGFDVVTNLQYWDGSGAVNFGTAPADVELGLQRGSFTTYVSGIGQTGTEPLIGSTGVSGRLHVHLGSLLSYTDGISPGLPNAPDGIYMLGMTLSLPGSGMADSDTLYFVYNNGLDEQTHDLAIDWVQNTLVVPEPSTYALMATAVGALGLVGIRRRRKSLA